MNRTAKQKVIGKGDGWSAAGGARYGGFCDRVGGQQTARPTRLLSHVAIGFLTAFVFCPGAFAQSTNVPAWPNYDAFRMISDRNIFNPNRVARGAPRTNRNATTSAGHVESFTLVGLLSYEKGWFAFFEGTSADFKKVLQADTVIGPCKVASITADAVKLTLGTNDYALKVGMQMRREDEGQWFLSTSGEGSSRRRGVFSRSLTNGEPESLTTTNGTEVTTPEGEPVVVVVEGETAVNPSAGETPAGKSAATIDGTTDPVLLRLMQRRQEMNR